MYLTWLEKIAIKETGRKIAADSKRRDSRLFVYPFELTLSSLIEPDQSNRSSDYYRLGYSVRTISSLNQLVAYLSFALSCFRFSFVSSADIYICSSGRSRVYAMIAAIIIRLFGGRITIHDYRFHGEKTERSRVRGIGQQIEFGVCPDSIPEDSRGKQVSCRLENIPRGLYTESTKKQIVPRVFVYGDFERNRVVSLARRIHDLVKQKYPRSEFILINLFPEDVTAFSSYANAYSFRMATPENEAQLAEIMATADIGLLLTPGGILRCLTSRAGRANIPIFTNGFALSDRGDQDRDYIATRDSYSDMAGKITALVDNPELYHKRRQR